MKIAQVAPLVESVPPLLYGGTERVVAALIAELVALGHEVTLYASGDSSTQARLIPIVERALWRTTTPVNETLLHVVELSQATREASEYDVIHSHLDYLGFPFSRHSPAPFVHTMHGRLDLPELQTLFHEFPEAPVVSISNAQRVPIPNANWLATVYNGVPVEKVPFGAGRGGYLAFVGRISPEKGVAEAIEIALQAGIPLKIAARMPLQNLDNEWVKADWAYYRDCVRPRLDHPLIEFLGEVDDATKFDLLKDALGLLMPINWPEPFGLAMVEALASGTPVIARVMGSTPEIIDHKRTGFLCHTLDEMTACCFDLKQIDRGECRREAERRFSARTMALGYLQVYGRLCRPPTGENLALAGS